jgi:hypothetical protein
LHLLLAAPPFFAGLIQANATRRAAKAQVEATVRTKRLQRNNQNLEV